jgi:hypothetical protein
LKLRSTSVSWSLFCSNIPCTKHQILFLYGQIVFFFYQSHPIPLWGFLGLKFFTG